MNRKADPLPADNSLDLHTYQPGQTKGIQRNTPFHGKQHLTRWFPFSGAGYPIKQGKTYQEVHWGIAMTTFGYFLSTEEFGPTDLLEQARMAEQAGFEALWISDHYHPWTDTQGQSSFVWSVIGAL